MKKENYLIFVLFIIAIFVCCQKGYVNYDNITGSEIPYPPVTFAVISDPHYFSLELGTVGLAFENYLEQDRKLIRESSEILNAAIDEIIKQSPDFVLIPGDLTKDGEMLSHQDFAQCIKSLEENGISAYIVPGNHDVNNSEACKYEGDMAVRIATVTPEIFEHIYYDFGYGEALARDSTSLSYVVEPSPGLWIIGMDACLYNKNKQGHHSKAGGRFKQSTLTWIESMLIRAQQQNKAVIGFMHHAVLEHFNYQAEYFPDYVLKKWRAVSRLFAKYNMKILFTGHFHAQDIVVRYLDNGKFLFDIETGALVSYPCPWRMISITADQKMHIQSHFVDSIYSYPHNFPEHAFNFLQSGIHGIFLQKTRLAPLQPVEARRMANDFTSVLMAHYQGDESADDKHMAVRGCASCCLLGLTDEMIQGLEIDPQPPDNNVTIDLRTGEFYTF